MVTAPTSSVPYSPTRWCWLPGIRAAASPHRSVPHVYLRDGSSINVLSRFVFDCCFVLSVVVTCLLSIVKILVNRKLHQKKFLALFVFACIIVVLLDCLLVPVCTCVCVFVCVHYVCVTCYVCLLDLLVMFACLLCLLCLLACLLVSMRMFLLACLFQ